MKKIYIIGIGLIVLLLGISTASAGLFDGLLGDDSSAADDNKTNASFEKTEFKVHASQPQSVEGELQSYQKDQDFYDNKETQEWLKGLENYVILSTSGDSLVMERTEANKLPVFDDGKFETVEYNIIKCKVVEVHPLGTWLIDLILVEDVELVGNETQTFDLDNDNVTD